MSRTRNRRRKDMIVIERPNGELVPVERREFYRPKPPRALTVYQPQQVTVLPPRKSGKQELADALIRLSHKLRRPRPVHHVVVSEQPQSISFSYTKLTGEWARLVYLYNLLNR